MSNYPPPGRLSTPPLPEGIPVEYSDRCCSHWGGPELVGRSWKSGTSEAFPYAPGTARGQVPSRARPPPPAERGLYELRRGCPAPVPVRARRGIVLADYARLYDDSQLSRDSRGAAGLVARVLRLPIRSWAGAAGLHPVWGAIIQPSCRRSLIPTPGSRRVYANGFGARLPSLPTNRPDRKVRRFPP